MTTVPVGDDVMLAAADVFVEHSMAEIADDPEAMGAFIETLISKDALIGYATQGIMQHLGLDSEEDFFARSDEFRAGLAFLSHGLLVGIVFEQRRQALAALSD